MFEYGLKVLATAHLCPAPSLLAHASDFPCVCVRGVSTNTILYFLQSGRSMSENFPVWSLRVGGPEVDPCWDSLFDWVLWFLLSAKVEKTKEFHSKQGIANIEILVTCPYKLYFYKTCRWPTAVWTANPPIKSCASWSLLTPCTCDLPTARTQLEFTCKHTKAKLKLK